MAFQTEQTRLENRQLTQRNELNQKTITLQQILILSGILVSVLMVLVIFLILRNRNRMKRANAMLAKQNTEITLHSEQLLRLNMKLKELSQFKDNMNSFLVHDLKNSLNAMVHFGLAEPSPQQGETFRQLALQMLLIISNILDISKYENNTMPLKIVSVSFKALLHQASSECGYLAAQKGISLVYKSALPLNVLADEDILRRTLINLLTNAIKYSPDKSEITIHTYQDSPDFFRIEVRDQGEGIHQTFLPIIFDKFTQSDPRPSGGMPSTGIGLTFCKLAVESMGGTIGAESVPGEGSLFWFTLPSAAEQEPVQPEHETVVIGHPKNLQLSVKEKEEIYGTCALLKTLTIYAISDVKEVMLNLNSESPGILEWKRMVLQAVSDCNENSYNELISICG